MDLLTGSSSSSMKDVEDPCGTCRFTSGPADSAGKLWSVSRGVDEANEMLVVSGKRSTEASAGRVTS